MMKRLSILVLLAVVLGCAAPDVWSASPKGKKSATSKRGATAKKLTGTVNGHEWVDLGLPSGLKWATCNIGASLPSAYGFFFAWGETEIKLDFSLDSYEFLGDYEGFQSHGDIDSKGNLTMSHDVARKQWGGTWRMPTKEEVLELKANTTCTLTRQDGVFGCLVTSKTNGKSIFLPAAGFQNKDGIRGFGKKGIYWTSTLYSSFSSAALTLEFSPDSYINYGFASRYFGLPIRPVTQ